MKKDLFGVGGGVGIADDALTVGFGLEQIVQHQNVNGQSVFVAAGTTQQNRALFKKLRQKNKNRLAKTRLEVC